MQKTKIKHTWIVSENEIPTRQNHSEHLKKNVIFIGAPDDRGVLNVGGRIGASLGPNAFRHVFQSFGLGFRAKWNRLNVFSGFDIPILPTIKESHDAVRHNVLKSLKNNITPIVIGGGHDYGYPHLAGVSDFFGPESVALINIDAHFDVRPIQNGVISSGTPFYMALENKVIHPKNFIEFGIQDHCNASSLLDYLSSQKVKIYTLDELRKNRNTPSQRFEKLLKLFSRAKKKIVISIDLDAFAMAYAPGVSAPQADGLTAQDLMEICSISGRSPNVVSMGFFELNPVVDVAQTTSLLAATATHRYLTELSLQRVK